MKKMVPAVMIAGILVAGCAAPTQAPTVTPSQLVVEPTAILTPPTEVPTTAPTDTPTSTPTATPTSTPIPQDVPPVIQIEAPTEAVTGERVVLDASRTFDHDGDEISFEWRQVHNPDRYTGAEYVTGQQVMLENHDEPLTAFTAQWPGNYSFEVSAADKDGARRETVNVIIHPTAEVFAIRGMAIDQVNGAWSESQAAGMIEYIRGLGFNYLQIGIHDTMESPSSNEMLIDRCDHPWFMPLDQNVALIDMAHDYGLGVMISPHMGCIIDGQWYEFYNMSPSDPAEWFESYQRYALFYAELAQEHDVEILNIGGGTDQFNTFAEEWGELLDEIRTVYTGRLAFSWFNFPPWPGGPPPFPHLDKLDILANAFTWNGSGISFTGTRTGHSHPAIPEMTEWFNLELGRYVDGLQSQSGKPVIATDIYPWSVDGMNIDPAGLHWVDERPIDNQEPVDYAEAAFRVIAAREWEGVFFWSLPVGPPRAGQPDIRGRPIEQMIKIWFSPASDWQE